MTKDSVEKLLDDTYEAFNRKYQPLSRLLKNLNIPVSQGWSKTRTVAVDNYVDNQSDENVVRRYQRLKSFLLTLLTCSDKAVFLHKVDSSVYPLIAWDTAFTIDTSLDIVSTFPNLLDKSKHLSIGKGVHLVSKYKIGNQKLRLVYSNINSVVIKEPVPTSQVDSSLAKTLKSYDKIFVQRHLTKQVFSVVDISSSGEVVIRIDAGEGASDRIIMNSYYKVVNALKLAFGLNQADKLLNHPKNCFNKIQDLYRANEGKVVELTFITPEGLRSNERTRTSMRDIRKDTFHTAGQNAVQNVGISKVSIQFSPASGNNISNPELSLSCGMKELASQAPYLGYSTINNCYDESMFDNLVSKLA